MQHYRQKWGTKRFILTGYSFGADVCRRSTTACRTPSSSVDAIILLAFARTGSFEIEVEGWLGNAGKPPPARKWPSCRRQSGVHLRRRDRRSGCTDKTAVGEAVKLPGGHH
jgi:type IV secretory pathway VirJ component